MNSLPATKIPDTRRRILILRNPKAGAYSSRKPLAALIEGLKSDEWSVKVCDSFEEVRNESLIATQSDELRCVIAAGGDGTIAAAVNESPYGTPITPFPLGNENLLARHFGIRPDVAQARETIRQGHVVVADAGQANGRLFLIMLSCGFDAEVVERTHQTRTGHISRWDYIKSILNAARQYQYPELKITGDPGTEQERQISTHWAFAFNLPDYAVGLQIAPSADAADGQLDLCTFDGQGFPKSLMHFGTVLIGQHGPWSQCRQQRVTTMRIEADSDQPVPYQMDGDPGGHLPVTVEVIPQRLSLMIPPPD